MIFWENFYNLCVSKKEKPNTVCSKLGFSSAAATHWKNGTIPKGDALVLIADYFNVSVDFLLSHEKNDNNSSNILNTNKKIILELFDYLTDTQQGELIGRAKMMVEQNESVFRQEGAG